jgi:hypothetical protein
MCRCIRLPPSQYNYWLTFFFTELHGLRCLVAGAIQEGELVYPPPSIGLLYLLRSNLIFTIRSCRLMPCTISIWCCDMILPIPMYDTHLRATDMTTSSIGGAQIHIYLVNSTTDSLC